MIAGVMRIYNGSIPTLEVALRSLNAICDKTYLVLDRVKIPDSVDLRPGTVIHRVDRKGPFHHTKSLTEAFHLTDADSPRWVLIPDSDEVLPSCEFPGVLKTAERAKKMAVSFDYCVPWDGLERCVENVPTGAHVKAVRWSPDIDFQDPSGFCVPVGYWQKIHHCRSPLLHLYCMNEELRRQRMETGRTIDEYGDNPDTIPIPEDLRI